MRSSTSKAWQGSHWIRPLSRLSLYLRDGFRCVFCGRGVPEAVLTLDHVVPAADGGGNERTNLVTACWECNTTRAGGFLGSWIRDVSEATGEPRADIRARVDAQRLTPVTPMLEEAKRIQAEDPEWYQSLRKQASTSYRGTLLEPERFADDGSDLPF